MGCADSIVGAQRQVRFYDPASGKLIAVWDRNGDDAKIGKATFTAPDGKGKLELTKVEETDTVGGYQFQAVMAGIQLGNNLATGIGSKFGANVPNNGYQPLQMTEKAQAVNYVLDLEGLTEAERAAALSLLTKGKPKKATAPASQPATSPG